MGSARYQRVLIKISGEAIGGENGHILNFDVIDSLCGVLMRCAGAGAQIGLVVGAGNIWRGAKDGGGRLDRSRADHMGMLATAINALALAGALESRGAEVRVQTAVEMRPFAEPYARGRAVRHLERGRIVVFGCGTGNPFFSTDTAAVLRGAEIGADIVLLAKNIDGVYDGDPRLDPSAKKYDHLDFDTILSKNLAVIDAAAASLARDTAIPVLLFALSDPENIYRAVMGEHVGTVVTK